MDFTSSPLITGLEARMRFAQARQKVVSDNIANADTPAYEARTLAEPNFSAVLSAVSAGPGHVAKPHIAMPAAFSALGSHMAARDESIKDPHVSETKPNGNTVNLEDQLMEMQKTQLEYGELTNIYKKQMGLFRLALGNR